ncbi:MAG: hypothetical protein RI965_650 [Bacteroidota bacterium]|jgi:uncharacterized protein (TIGR00661 family)
MKIFYAVQATGNGHVSRATEILPYLLEHGEVDVFLSGSNFDLKKDLPIAYRSKGLSLEYNQKKGSIDLWKTVKNARPKRIWKEAKYLPIEKYDLIINDFECITSLACKIKNIPSVHFGHQASFRSPHVPRPVKKEFTGEFILSNYATGTKTIGLHFKKYDDFIFQPIIKKSILDANPIDNGHITVYLSQYSPKHLIKILKQLKNHSFHLFSTSTQTIIQEDNIKLFPINQNLFNQSLITCHGIITGGGFETPAEAMYLGKKLMIIPIDGQYEQQCNAAALKQDFNITVMHEMDDFFPAFFNKWIYDSQSTRLVLQENTKDIVNSIFSPLPQKNLHSIRKNQIPVDFHSELERVSGF